MTAVIPYTPIRDGYSSIPTYPIVETMLEGGKTRKRLNPLFATHEVTVNWKLVNPVDYTNFMGFFRTTLKEATEYFLMDLVTDIGWLTTHRCKTKSGMPKLTQVNGNCFYATAILEVDVNPTYTGLILYQEPDLVIFTHSKPSLVGPFQPGDGLRILNSSGIHPGGPTDINIDGVYEVDTVSGSNQIQLADPQTVASDWLTIAVLGSPGQYGPEGVGDVISTITKVPT